MAVDDHGDRGVVVLDSRQDFFPELPRSDKTVSFRPKPMSGDDILGSHVAVIEPEGEVHVYSGDLRGEDCGSGTAFQVDELSNREQRRISIY